MSMASLGVVVWEWLSDSGRWQAYEPLVSDYIESCKVGIVHLANCDPSYGSVTLDRGAMIQLDRGSIGLARPVRRHMYAADGPAGQGISWQWSGDRPGEWHRYDFEVASILESAWNTHQLCIDLSKLQCALPYVIDFGKMTQTRIETGFVRCVKRVTSSWRYMLIASLRSNSSSGHLQSIHRFAPAAHSAKVSSQSVSSSAVSCTFNGLCTYGHHGGQSASSGFGSSSVAHGALVSYTGSVYPGVSLAVTASSVANSSAVGTLPVMPSHMPLLASSLPFGSSNPNMLGSSSRLLHNGVTNLTGVLSSTQNPVAVSRKPGTRTRDSTTSVSSKRLKVGEKQVPSTVSNAGMPFSPEELLKPYFNMIDKPPHDEDCAICCEQLADPSGYDQSSNPNAVQLSSCNHRFHQACLFAMYQSGTKDGSLQCPTCKTIYGTKFGNCPMGTMEYMVISGSLPGFEDCNIIRITYMISPGVQGLGHPNPGRKFTARGFPRYGYLPNNPQGQKVLHLLIKAWERRLTFTIGTSVTTGESDTVVWNEIHHKTEITNNTGHGYPDPNYLDNVTAELAVHGITDVDSSKQ